MLTKAMVLITLLLGTIGSYVTAMVQDVQLPMVMLSCFACLLGAAYPDGAWRRALMLGLSVPLAHLVSGATGVQVPYPAAHFADSFIALVPAFLGTYFGVWLRRLVGTPQKEQTREEGQS